MDYFFGTFVLILCAYLYSRYDKKKRYRKLRIVLHRTWGKPVKNNFIDFSLVRAYFEHKSTSKNSTTIRVSDPVTDDLDLHDVFIRLNKTRSKIGTQYLYYLLRTEGTAQQLQHFNTLRTAFSKQPELAINCQLALSELGHSKVYYFEQLIHGAPIKPSKYHLAIQVMTVFTMALLVGSFFMPILSLGLIPILAINTVVHYANKSNLHYYLNGVTQLNKALRIAKSLYKNELISKHFGTMPCFSKLEKMKLKTEFIAFENHIDNEFLFAFWMVSEIIKILFNIEYLAFFSFTKDLSTQQQSLDELFCFLGEIDSALAIASVLAEDTSTCMPVFTERTVAIKNLYHPLLEKPVTNSLQLEGDSVLLTGSNMSGKTTFIRTVAVNALLAQRFHFAFATSYRAPFYRVLSSIRISDNLQENTSYFLAEVQTVKTLLEAADGDRPCLFVLDELLKGTNTAERVSAAFAILKYLNQTQHTVFAATHDLELTSLLKNYGYLPYHFKESVAGGGLIFDYKLQEGILQKSNAIEVLKSNEYPNSILEDARATRAQYFNQK